MRSEPREWAARITSLTAETTKPRVALVQLEVLDWTRRISPVVSRSPEHVAVNQFELVYTRCPEKLADSSLILWNGLFSVLNECLVVIFWSAASILYYPAASAECCKLACRAKAPSATVRSTRYEDVFEESKSAMTSNAGPGHVPTFVLEKIAMQR